MAYITRISDGDTLVVLLDREFYDSSVMRIRLKDINAPELSTEAGKTAREFLSTELPLGTPVIVRTYKQTYDRYEGVVEFMHNGAMKSLAQHMVEAGHAVWR
jgi:endonuclease YncB( thermonuclease family)